jgi:hypothetical protein
MCHVHDSIPLGNIGHPESRTTVHVYMCICRPEREKLTAERTSTSDVTGCPCFGSRVRLIVLVRVRYTFPSPEPRARTRMCIFARGARPSQHTNLPHQTPPHAIDHTAVSWVPLSSLTYMYVTHWGADALQRVARPITVAKRTLKHEMNTDTRCSKSSHAFMVSSYALFVNSIFGFHCV